MDISSGGLRIRQGNYIAHLCPHRSTQRVYHLVRHILRNHRIKASVQRRLCIHVSFKSRHGKISPHRARTHARHSHFRISQIVSRRSRKRIHRVLCRAINAPTNIRLVSCNARNVHNMSSVSFSHPARERSRKRHHAHDIRIHHRHRIRD